MGKERFGLTDVVLTPCSDIEMFIAHGGNAKDGSQELEAIKIAQSSVRLPSPPSELEEALSNLCVADANEPSFSTQSPFVVKMSATADGVGAFATRPLKRGEMILTELPSFFVSQNAPDPIKFRCIESAVSRLTPLVLDQYLSLTNSHTECSCFPSNPVVLGIFSTNAFMLQDVAVGICMQT